MAAAQSVATGESDIALCLMGGQTHARRDCASGFSYVNDVVLAILQMLRVPAPEPQIDRRVLFVNVDGHHCSGVEEAFYTTDRVCTVSLHRYAVGIFPGSGGLGDVGQAAGKGHNINLPVSDGLDDAALAALLHPVLTATAERFCPHCVVVCAGGGIISGDRLGCLNVSVAGHAAYLRLLLDLELPTLVLGGGGYTQLNTARVWAHATAMACGVTLDTAAALPTSDGGILDGYPPDATLAVPPATMENLNTEASLATAKAQALATIESMPQRTKPPPPPKKAAEDVKPTIAADEGGAAAAEGAAPQVEGAADVAAPTGGDAGEGSGDGASTGGDGEAASAPHAGGADDAAGGDAMEVDEKPVLGEGGGAEPVMMSEDGMQAQEPGLGDDD